MPIVVLTTYTEKEYEPLGPYSRSYPAMPVSVCFLDTALYTRSKMAGHFEMKPNEELKKARGLFPGSEAQLYLDTQVVAATDPYVPMDTGLLKSAPGTPYGSGKVHYETPYARYQLGHGRAPGTSVYGPLRGRDFWNRMKADCKEKLFKALAAFAGAKAEG